MDGDAQQWRLLGESGHVRPGAELALANDGSGACLDADLRWTRSRPEAAVVTVHRVGSSLDPVRRGEPFSLRVAQDWLVAAPPGADGDLERAGVPDAQWEVTGAPGSAVPTDRPVGLFNLVHGDHLATDPSGALVWAGRLHPDAPLPVPAALRAPDGRSGEVEVDGIVTSGSSAGLLAGHPLDLALDDDVAALVAEHLTRRLPPSDPVPVTARVRIDPPAVSPADPARDEDAVRAGLGPGVRVRATGLLTTGPDGGLRMRHARSLAWARDVAGSDLVARPHGAGWPASAVTWRLLALPATAGRGAQGRRDAVLLALPSRDGERSSSTTFSPAFPPAHPARPRVPVSPPSLVRDPRTGRRALRLVVPDADEGPVLVTCAIRVWSAPPGKQLGSQA